jgi:phosphorylated adapter RNA export protein
MLLSYIDSTDEDFGKEIAKNLEEEKSDLIVRVVSVIGKEQTQKLYENTQRIERNGGMMILNKTRRRTPGGVFLFLLKTSNCIDEKMKKEIFEPDQQLQHRSNETDPPNSPEKAEFECFRQDNDLSKVSQKILSMSANISNSESEDVLDLNYNDMDTF